jgi:hypothetical protein
MIFDDKVRIFVRELIKDTSTKKHSRSARLLEKIKSQKVSYQIECFVYAYFSYFSDIHRKRLRSAEKLARKALQMRTSCSVEVQLLYVRLDPNKVG